VTLTAKSLDSQFAAIEPIFQSHIQAARRNQHRLPLVLHGPASWCRALAQQLLQRFAADSCLWLSDWPQAPGLAMDKATQVLGLEYDAIVFDGHCGLDPDALGAVSGAVRGGGVLLLLLPELEALEAFDDPFANRMAIWPYSGRQMQRRFVRRLRLLLQRSKSVLLMGPNTTALQLPLPTPLDLPKAQDWQNPEKPGHCATPDQLAAVEAVLHVLEGHRRRPLVVTSDRGRGKSAALGIAAAQFLARGDGRILITAPSLATAQPAFKHARQLLPQAQFENGVLRYDKAVLEFMAPDVLIRTKYTARLVLVDEAAAIPVPILEHILRNYSRVVYCSTIHGYEGTGRGFAVRFHAVLDQLTPGWQHLRLETPIRWSNNDPLESFIFELLLLNATPAPEANIAAAHPHACSFEQLQRDQLLQDEPRLKELFGLLVIAHYQTQAKDLRYLLDGKDLRLYTLSFSGHIVATAFIEQEGGLDATTCQQVYQNRRRVRGHWLPQTLETFVGLEGAAQLRYRRIVRIAVHPSLQRRGLASLLLQNMLDQARREGVDGVGATFGATADLLAFWRKNNFYPVHIGIKRNASSGTQAVTLMQAISASGEQISRQAESKLASQFPFMLAETFAQLDRHLVLECLKILPIESVGLPAWELADLQSFAFQLRGYELTAPSIWKLTLNHFTVGANTLQQSALPSGPLSPLQQDLLLSKVLQRHDWETVVQALQLQGKSQAVKELRAAVAGMLQPYT